MPVAKNIAERLRKKREEKNKPFKAGEGRIIDPTKEASGRAPIQRKLTRKQKIDQLKPLQESAKRAGVDTGSRAKRDSRVAPPQRAGVKTDLDRLADVRETLGSETQAPLEVQLQLRDVARELDRQRLAERKKVGSGLLQQQIEGKGIPQGAVSLDEQGRVVVNVGAALGNVSMERFIKNNKPGFRFKGQLSTDPEIADLQKQVAQAQFTGSANIGTLQDNLRKAILGKVGRTDFREVALDPEFEQRLAAEQKQAEFLAARTVGAQPELTQSEFNQKIAAFQAERRETLKQADLLKQEEGIEFDNERRRQRQIAEARIDTASPAVRAAVKAQAFKNIDDKINKRRDERFEEIDASVDKAIKGIEGDEAEARAEALEKTKDPAKERQRRIEQERNDFINKKVEEGMSVTDADRLWRAEQKRKDKALEGDFDLESAFDDFKALQAGGQDIPSIDSVLAIDGVDGNVERAEKIYNAGGLGGEVFDGILDGYRTRLGFSEEDKKLAKIGDRRKKVDSGNATDEEIVSYLNDLEQEFSGVSGESYRKIELSRLLGNQSLRGSARDIIEDELADLLEKGSVDISEKVKGTAKDGFFYFRKGENGLPEAVQLTEGSGSGESLDLREQRAVRFDQLPSHETKAVISGLQAIYGRLSDEDLLNGKAEYVKHKEEGGTFESYLEEESGFLPVPSELAIQRQYLFSKGMGKLETLDNRAVIQHLKAGNDSAAYNLLENKLLEKSDRDFKTERSIRIHNAQKGRILDLLNDPKNAALVGKIKGPINQFFARNVPGIGEKDRERLTALNAAMTTSVTEFRKAMLGSAVTPAEEKFLTDILPTVNDTPGQIKAKTESLSALLLDTHNAARLSVGLPRLSESDLPYTKRPTFYKKMAYADYMRKNGVDPNDILKFSNTEGFIDATTGKNFTPAKAERYRQFIMEELDKEVERQTPKRPEPREEQDTSLQAEDLSSFISQAERADANTIIGFDAFKEESDLPITGMTIKTLMGYQDEILERQKEKGIPAKQRSTAVGKYQILKPTLQALVKREGISEDEVFTEELQDRLFNSLLKDANVSGFLAGDITEEEFAKKLSRIWASLPMDETGKGTHEQEDGFNRASVSFKSLIDQIRKFKSNA